MVFSLSSLKKNGVGWDIGGTSFLEPLRGGWGLVKSWERDQNDWQILFPNPVWTVTFSFLPVWGSGQSCWYILELHSWWWGPLDCAGLSEHRSKDGRCSCPLLQRVLSACAQKSSRSTGGDGNSRSHFPKPEGKDAGDKINQAYSNITV